MRSWVARLTHRQSVQRLRGTARPRSRRDTDGTDDGGGPAAEAVAREELEQQVRARHGRGPRRLHRHLHARTAAGRAGARVHPAPGLPADRGRPRGHRGRGPPSAAARTAAALHRQHPPARRAPRHPDTDGPCERGRPTAATARRRPRRGAGRTRAYRDRGPPRTTSTSTPYRCPPRARTRTAEGRTGAPEAEPEPTAGPAAGGAGGTDGAHGTYDGHGTPGTAGPGDLACAGAPPPRPQVPPRRVGPRRLFRRGDRSRRGRTSPSAPPARTRRCGCATRSACCTPTAAWTSIRCCAPGCWRPVWAAGPARIPVPDWADSVRRGDRPARRAAAGHRRLGVARAGAAEVVRG